MNRLSASKVVIFGFVMKTFAKYIAFLLIIGIAFPVLSFRIFFHYYCESKLNIPPTKTTVVFGASNGQCAINDNILSSYINCGYPAVSYYTEKEFIRSLIDRNPHISTVIFSYTPFIYNTYSDEFQFEQFAYMVKYMCPYLFYKESELPPLEIFKVFFRLPSELINHFDSLNTIPGYDRRVGCKIRHGHWSEEWYDERYPSVIDLPYKETVSTHRMNHDALREVIGYCLMKGKKVIIFMAPLYHFDRWFGRNGYDQFIGTLDQSVLIADYIDFPMPSDEFYYDVQHLNDLGSDYLSKYIKSHGLRTESITEYLERRRKEKHE